MCQEMCKISKYYILNITHNILNVQTYKILKYIYIKITREKYENVSGYSLRAFDKYFREK